MIKQLIHTIFYSLLIITKLVGQNYLKVEPVTFNHVGFSEIAPFIYKKGLIYTSNLKVNVIETKKSVNNEYFYNVYFYHTNKQIKIHIDSMFSQINTSFHDGPMAAYGDTFIVSQNFYIKGGKKHKAPVGIFFYDFSQNKVSPEIKPFTYNNKSFRVGHPFLTPDGKYLYFSSDMPGGFGGFDLYVCQKKDTTWDVPINLGSTINTDKNEIFPYFINNRLYFSSDRIPEKKFDIFYSELENNQWQPVVNLPEPINSEYNDFSFICDSTFDNGYFASNRKKDDDIYHFYSIIPVFEQCDTMIEKNLCFHFLDETSQYIDTLPVIYEWDFGDSTKVKAWEADHCYNDYGTYYVRLIMIDTLTDEIQEVANYTMDIQRTIQPYITFSDSIITNVPVIFDSKDSYFPNGTIEQYYWIFSDGFKYIGPTCERIFTKPGRYWVHLGFSAIDENKVSVNKCSIVEFDVH